ncbi:nucleotidyl transferase AbiEii/AbiGii toxin family protein [Capnocytophaga bilenii]|jgi:uncharacterized protein aq_aa25
MLLKDNKALEAPQKKLLKELMSLEALADYCLVGGTNLAFRYEHRISVDLDIFRYNKNANKEVNTALFAEIKEVFGDAVQLNGISKIGIFMYINDVKVDVIEYPYPFFNIQTLDGIRLASKEDICAMKINAIVGRGSRKDFYDLNQLLKEYSLAKILELYKEKYANNNMQMIMRSLIYFLDADNDDERNNQIISLRGEKWENVKKEIEEKYNELFMNR